MNIFSPTDHFDEFLNFMAMRKPEFEGWRYMHLFVDRGVDTSLPIDEILQFLTFHFPKKPPIVLRLPTTNQMLLITNKNNLIALNKFEKGVLDNFRNHSLRTEVRGFDSGGLDHFIKMITPHIEIGNPVQRTLLTRLSRMGNRIMVIDDDIPATKQLEKVLSGFGYVVVLNKSEGFLEQYMEYAPDIVFLETKMKVAHGPELLKNLVARVDPYAHVVMMGGETTQKMVVDAKDAGAKGFMLKPFNQNVLFQYLARAPTFVLRNGKI